MAETGSSSPPGTQRNHAMFDAEFSGAALNMQLLRRLLRWLRPYRLTFGISAVLVLLASTLQVLMPVVLSLVVIDPIIRGEADPMTPDLGMIGKSETFYQVVPSRSDELVADASP